MSQPLGRRTFAAQFAGLAAGVALPWAASAQSRFEEGVNYTRLPNGVAVDSAPGQVEVLEFFCLHLYPLLPL